MLIDKEKLEKFIDQQGVAFVSSIDGEGFPNMKAMLPARKREGLRVLYFSTNTSSKRAEQYRQNPKASIYFYRKRVWRYQGLMLTGTMEVLEDAAHKEMIWRKGDKIFYPEGVTDPDYCVFRFTAQAGRYYCNFETESFSV